MTTYQLTWLLIECAGAASALVLSFVLTVLTENKSE